MYAENVKFYLHSPKSNSPTAIFAKIYLNSKEVKIRIGLKIHPELWDPKSQRPLLDKKILNQWRKQDPTIKTVLGNIEARINKVSNEITSYVNLLEHSGKKVTSSMVRLHVQESLGLVQKQVVTQSIIDYTKQFIKDIESGKRLTSDKARYSVGTIKNYNGFITQLKEFQTGYKKTIHFDDIDLDFYDAYVQFFQEKDYSPNTIGRHIKHLKVIMGSGEQDGLHSNRSYFDKRFKTLTAPVDSIYLNEEEINKIRKQDLSGKPKYELVRDLFILGTQTALRFSDLKRLRPHHIHDNNGDQRVEIHMLKVAKKVIVPLNSIAKAILEKYKFTIPTVTNQVFNRYIKDIAKWADIDQEVEIIKYQGAEKIYDTVPKYELISTHTARRSAATNLVKSGLSLEHVRRITGHSSIKNLLKYIRLTEDEVYDQLKLSSFFKK